MSLADDILAFDDRKIEAVVVPEWNTTVYLRVMDGIEREQFEDGEDDRKGNKLRAALLVRTICDADGKRVFADSQVDALARKSSTALRRLFQRALELNSVGDEVEKTRKNS
jgi:hypothetical protein